MRSAILKFGPPIFIFVFLFVPFVLNLHFCGGAKFEALIDNAGRIRFTIWQAFLSSLFTMLLGLPGAYLVGRTRMHPLLKKLFRLLSSIPFVLPGITVALGFFLTFGRNGPYLRFLRLFGFSPQLLYTFTAVLLGHVFYNFPLFIRIVGEAWESIDAHVVEAAKLDGASGRDSLRYVELPLLLPSILRAFFLTYIYTFTSFSVVLILGGIKYSTIEVSIYTYSRVLFDFKSAATLMLFQLLFLLFLGYFTTARHTLEESFTRPHHERFPRWGIPFSVVSAALVFVPLVAAGMSGFLDHFGRLSTKNFELLFSGDIEYLVGSTLREIAFYTVLVSSLATGIALAVATVSGYYSSRGSKLQYVVLIPATMSSVTIAFSYVLIDLPVVLKLVLVHSLIVLPVVFGIIESGWRKVPQAFIEYAKLEGAGPFAMLRKVVLPLMFRPLLSAIVYAFTLSVGETSATLTLAEPPVVTFSATVFRLMSSRNTEMAMALNSIYFALVLFLFLFVEFASREEL